MRLLPEAYVGDEKPSTLEKQLGEEAHCKRVNSAIGQIQGSLAFQYPANSLLRRGCYWGREFSSKSFGPGRELRHGFCNRLHLRWGQKGFAAPPHVSASVRSRVLEPLRG